MMEDVTTFHKLHLGGQGMFEYAYMQGFIQDLGGWEGGGGGITKFPVDM